MAVRRAGGSTGGGLRAYLAETSAPLGAAALTLPLLLVHGLGATLAPEVRNGADVLSVAIAAAFSAAGWGGATPWAALYGGLAVVQLGLVVWLAGRGQFQLRWVAPFLAECGTYAVACGLLASVGTAGLLGAIAAPGEAAATAAALPSIPRAATSAALAPGMLDAILISFGAGFHEELVFRLGAIAGVGRRWLGDGWRRHLGAVMVLVVAAAALFSAAHHLIEPFQAGVFVFRAAMGLLFGVLFLLRGFAVAAWTHALYDIWVLAMLHA